MVERGPSRAGSVPWGLVGMVALVAAIESGVARHRDDFSTPIAAYFESASRAARSEAVGRDVLCFGDSVIKFGVVPRVIEERAGLRSYNLSTMGNPSPVAHLLLRQALEAGARPKAVFVDFKPILLGGYQPEPQSLGRIAGLADGLDLAWTFRDATWLGGFATRWALPSIRDRPAIRRRILEAFGGLVNPDRAGIEALRRNWAVNQGAQVLPPNPLAAATPEFPNEPANLRADWSCHPVASASIDRFFRLASDHRIRVYWLLTPIHPRLQASRDRLGIDDSFTKFVRERSEAAGPGVVVVDARRLGVDPDLFVDATHLDRRGAVALSTALADFLIGSEAGDRADRWVVLPARGRPVDDRRIEDTDQTGLALRLEAEARRR